MPISLFFLSEYLTIYFGKQVSNYRAFHEYSCTSFRVVNAGKRMFTLSGVHIMRCSHNAVFTLTCVQCKCLIYKNHQNKYLNRQSFYGAQNRQNDDKLTNLAKMIRIPTNRLRIVFKASRDAFAYLSFFLSEYLPH